MLSINIIIVWNHYGKSFFAFFKKTKQKNPRFIVCHFKCWLEMSDHTFCVTSFRLDKILTWLRIALEIFQIIMKCVKLIIWIHSTHATNDRNFDALPFVISNQSFTFGVRCVYHFSPGFIHNKPVQWLHFVYYIYSFDQSNCQHIFNAQHTRQKQFPEIHLLQFTWRSVNRFLCRVATKIDANNFRLLVVVVHSFVQYLKKKKNCDDNQRITIVWNGCMIWRGINKWRIPHGFCSRLDWIQLR